MNSSTPANSTSDLSKNKFWSDWLWSLAVHALLLTILWWTLHLSQKPQYVTVDTPIKWGSQDIGGGGGNHVDGGGSRSGNGTKTQTTTSRGMLTETNNREFATGYLPQSRATTPKSARAATTEMPIAAKKRALATQLATERKHIPKTGLDAAKTGGNESRRGSDTGLSTGAGLSSDKGPENGSGFGSGMGSGVGSGSGEGSGSGSGAGSGYGSGTEKEKNHWRNIFHAYLSSRKRYPNVTRRLRQEGTVKVYASFAANGALLSANVARSSGHAALDEAALQLVSEAAAITAGKAQPGKALSFNIPVIYKLVD